MTEPADLTGSDKLVAALDRIARALRAHRQTVATAAGVSPLQADVVRILGSGTPTDPTVGLLAAELGLAQPTVSEAVSTLRRKGLVLRSGAADDRRRSVVRLTRRGRDLARELDRADDPFRDCVELLSADDRDQTLGVLLELIAGLLGAGVIEVSRSCPVCRFFDETGERPRCGLLQLELLPGDLRVDCPEHQAVG